MWSMINTRFFNVFTQSFCLLLMDLQNKLFEACQVGDLEQIRKLIAEGVDPKKVKTRRWTVDVRDVGLDATPLYMWRAGEDNKCMDNYVARCFDPPSLLSTSSIQFHPRDNFFLESSLH